MYILLTKFKENIYQIILFIICRKFKCWFLYLKGKDYYDKMLSNLIEVPLTS